MDITALDPKQRDVAHFLKSISFTYYTPDEIRAISCKEITSPVPFDALGRPIKGGLYDPCLGTISQSTPCKTCGLGYFECPGHLGHIELPVPVVNPTLFSTLYKILNAKCWYCHSFAGHKRTAELLLAKLYALDCNNTQLVHEIDILLDATAAQKISMESDMSEALIQDMEELRDNAIKKARNLWFSLVPAGEVCHRTFRWRRTVKEFLSLSTNISKCTRCQAPKIKLRKDRSVSIFRLPKKDEAKATHRLESLSEWKEVESSEEEHQVQEGEEEPEGEQEQELNPSQSLSYLVTTLEMVAQMRALWKEEIEICNLIWGSAGRPSRLNQPPLNHEMFFVTVIPCPASRFRPPTISADPSTPPMEHPQNYFLSHAIMISQKLLEQDERPADDPNVDPGLKRVKLINDLQLCVNSIVDSQKGGQIAKNVTQSGATGIKEQLEHKAGLFRMHMMGKRVNFSARSVIGPDPFLDTNEIGVPVSFAKKLTYPEVVASYNLEMLQKSVERGPDVHPGANFIDDGFGVKVALQSDKAYTRFSMAKLLDKRKTYAEGALGEKKRVLRHLKTGDLVLFNRQPSLHRPSIMAHKVRVLPKERTIRMHYANCNSYNADFDGDEMNMHFPQDEVAKAEAAMLMLTDNQYITPTSGLPLRGLIQDHVVAGVLITKLDTFLNRDAFQQLLFGACDRSVDCDYRIRMPIPAVLKPVRLWTGKQLISSIMDIISHGRTALYLEGTSRTKASAVGHDETRVLVRQGQLLRGVLDKNQFGSSEYGLVHAFYELYGGDAAGRLLSAFGRLFTLFIRLHAHTTGVDDLLLLPQTEYVRTNILEAAQEDVPRQVISKLTKNEDMSFMDEKKLNTELVKFLSITPENEDVLDSAMTGALSKVTSASMEACFPGGLVKKFPLNGFQLMTATGAKGSAVNAAQISCQLGQTQLEGKRVPRNARGATLPCFDPYDPSPRAGGYIKNRFLTGVKPPEYFFHCMAGREGLIDTAVKTARSGYLQRCLVKHLEGISLHYDYSVRNSDNSVIQFVYGDDGIDPCQARWLSGHFPHLVWHVENFIPFCEKMGIDPKKLPKIEKAMEEQLLECQMETAIEQNSPMALSKFGVQSNKFYELVDKFCKTNSDLFDSKHNPRRPSISQFKSLMALRYQHASANPGDAVGVIAAQSIGEPSTQMTLNTFHFAGMGVAHVTLGIPRLRELLMTATKKPTTPLLKVPILDVLDDDAAKKLAVSLARVSLSDLLLGITVRECGLATNSDFREMNVRLHFAKPEDYQEALGVDLNMLLATMNSFYKSFKARIREESMKVLKSMEHVKSSEYNTIRRMNADELESVKKKRGVFLIDDEEEDEELVTMDRNEMDATDVKMAKNVDQLEDHYESPDEDEVQVLQSKPQSLDQKEDEEPAEVIMAVSGQNWTVSKDGTWIEVDVEVSNSVWGRVMLPDLAKKAAKSIFILKTEGITKSYINSSNNQRCLQTEGANIERMWQLWKELDLAKLYSNDVYYMLNTYGVEAARATLVGELKAVFDAYGIQVDRRHLNLIADYMTFEGEYLAFNRIGMAKAPSELQKMTFETALAFLTEAAMYGDVDPLKGPSANICVGSIAREGTGSFDVFQRLALQS